MKNDFLKHLTPHQVQAIVDYMEKKTEVAGTIIIQEGEAGGYHLGWAQRFSDVYSTQRRH